VATRGAKSTSKKAKATKSAKRSAKGATLGNSPKRLAQAKKGRSSERRTTLRVPRVLETEISRVARELGISENQALVHLAALGAESAQRKREVRRVVERRRIAISKAASVDTGAGFPSPEEMREAILVDRD
jgi:hypothetical protein